jgi:hypothetical protein
MATTDVPSDGARKFDPKFSAAELVKSLDSEIEQEQVKTLSRLANLSVPVRGGAQPEFLDSAIKKVLEHGETTVLFDQLFSLFHKGALTREDLDQRLLNWALKIPALKGKFDELPHETRAAVDQFKDTDLNQENPVRLSSGFKTPLSSSTAKKIATLKAAWQRQFDSDKGLAYPDVVENNGEKVKYVDKLAFENWAETIKNTPAVSISLHISLTYR